MGYTGSVDLVSGIRPKNNGTFPLVDAKDVRVDDNTRLDSALENIAVGAAGAVRYDAAQTLTDEQKQQARENIGATEVDGTLSVEGMAADAKNTGDEISALRGDLNKSIFGIGEKILFDKIPNEYVERSGEIKPYSNWTRSDFIPVDEFDAIMFKNSVGATQYGAKFDSSKNPIPNSGFSILGNNNTYVPTDGAAYVMFAHATSLFDGIDVYPIISDGIANHTIYSIEEVDNTVILKNNANQAVASFSQTEIEVDSSLSEPGRAADSKATGDAIKGVKSLLEYETFQPDDIRTAYIENDVGNITTSSSWKTYIFKNTGYLTVECTVGSSSWANAITFYSDEDDLSSETYLPDYSIKANNGIDTYKTVVPDNCKAIAVSNRTATLETPTISLSRNTLDDMRNTSDQLSDVVNDISEFVITEEEADYTLQAYVNPETGIPSRGVSYDSYCFINRGYSSVKCKTSTSNGTAAIAFYSDNYPSVESFITAILPKASNSPREYDEEIPPTAKLILICNLHVNANFYINLNGNLKYLYNDTLSKQTTENSISVLNKYIEHIIHSSRTFNGLKYNKKEDDYFTMLIGSDFHGDRINYERMLEYAKDNNVFDAIIIPGDLNTNGFNEKDFENIYTANINRIDIPQLFVIGNHDVGGGNTSREKTGDDIYNTLEDCVSRFITPFMEKNGCEQGAGGYYYKDFTDKKIRLIALNEYEMPRVIDPNNSSKYLYSIWHRYISQNQANWFVSTLNTTPSGYGVIVIMHQMVDILDEYTDNKFNTPVVTIAQGDSLQSQGPIIQDVIDAFIAKTTLEKTYSNVISAPTTAVPDVSVNADFTSANGEFICYICGHTHADKIGKSSVATNKQTIIVMNTSSINKASYDDLWRAHGKKSQDCLDMLVFDTDKKKIRIIRIGANTTLDMTYRDMTSISYV